MTHVPFFKMAGDYAVQSTGDELVTLTLVPSRAAADRCCDLLAAADIPAIRGEEDPWTGGSSPVAGEVAVLVPISAVERASHVLAEFEAMSPIDDDDEDDLWDDDDDDEDDEFEDEEEEDEEDDELYVDDDEDDFEEDEEDEEE